MATPLQPALTTLRQTNKAYGLPISKHAGQTACFDIGKKLELGLAETKVRLLGVVVESSKGQWNVWLEILAMVNI